MTRFENLRKSLIEPLPALLRWRRAYNAIIMRWKPGPNDRGLYWLIASALLFVVLAITYIGLLSHYLGFEAQLMTEVIVTVASAVIVMALLGLTVFLIR